MATDLTGPNWRVINADCREAFRSLPAGSVHCIVTSPPYWGLRDYGLQPQVWGGDAECEHEFGTNGIRHKGGPQGTTGERANRANVAAQNAAQHISTGAFCRHCKAWLGSLGLEPTPELYVQHIVEVFRAARQALRDDGTLWLNIGDSYAASGMGGNPDESHFRKQATNAGSLIPGRKRPPGLKPKDLVGIPWMVAFALRADGWYLRDEIIWHKSNGMPSSVRDRTTRCHEQLFLLTKSRRYFYDGDAIREPCVSDGGSSFGKVDSAAAAADSGAQARRCERSDRERYIATGRNKRSVWRISTRSFKGAHFATFPPELVLPCVLAGSSEKGCCPKCGAPWKRVVDETFIPQQDVCAEKRAKKSNKGLDHTNNWGDVPRGTLSSQTTGWQPTCECAIAETISCTVADPFTGSGTVLQVAINTGRQFMGAELAEHYLPLIEERAAQPWQPKDQRKPKTKRRNRHKRERSLF